MNHLLILLLSAVLTFAVGCGNDNSDGNENGPENGSEDGPDGESEDGPENGSEDGPTEKSFDQLFPADNEIGDWVENTDTGDPGVEVAKSDDEAVALIDGSAEPFIEHGFITFGVEYYASQGMMLELRIWQMDNAAIARELYSDLTDNKSIYMAQPWTDIDVGQQGRVADTGASIWVNARSGSYYVESKIDQVTDEASNDAQAFAKAVIAKL